MKQTVAVCGWKGVAGKEKDEKQIVTPGTLKRGTRTPIIFGFESERGWIL